MILKQIEVKESFIGGKMYRYFIGLVIEDGYERGKGRNFFENKVR